MFTLQGVAEGEAAERGREMLRKVQISDPARVMRRYPHQLSGGMNQRVIIAMALAKDPTLLILDEPTTGLDATVEAEVLDLVSALREEFRSSVLFISHSLDVIARMCDRVGVLYAGRLVEEGTVDEVFNNPRHPYTVGLLRCIPRGGAHEGQGAPGHDPGVPARARRGAAGLRVRRPLRPGPGHLPRAGAGPVRDRRRAPEPLPLPREGPVGPARGDARRRSRPSAADGDVTPILHTRNVRKTFHQDGHEVRAVEDLTFALGAGETLGLVGESGSGKTTLARLLLGLTEPDEGSVVELDGAALAGSIAQARPRAGPRGADRLPEPRLGAQPALLDPPHHRPRADHADGDEGRRRRSRACATSPIRCASTCG